MKEKISIDIWQIGMLLIILIVGISIILYEQSYFFRVTSEEKIFLDSILSYSFLPLLIIGFWFLLTRKQLIRRLIGAVMVFEGLYYIVMVIKGNT